MSAVDVLAVWDAEIVCFENTLSIVDLSVPTRAEAYKQQLDRLTEARAAVADQQSDLVLLRDRIRHEANAHRGRIVNFDGDDSVEGVVAQQMLTTYTAQLFGFADELDAALARCKGASP